MSTYVTVRPLMARESLVLMATGPVTMDDVLGGPLRNMYAAGGLKGEVEIQLVNTDSPDGLLPESQRSQAANDAISTVDAKDLPSEAVQVTSPSVQPQRPTAVVRKLSLVR